MGQILKSFGKYFNSILSETSFIILPTDVQKKSN